MSNIKLWSRRLFLFLIVIIASSENVFADNYMRSEGEGYYTSRLQYDTARDRWDLNSTRVPMNCTARNWTLTQHYEYGLSYYNTVFGSADYLDRTCGIYGASGIGDISLGIRRRLNIYKNGRSWEAEAIIPTGYSTTGNSTIGSGLYGLRLGIFGSFGGNADEGGTPTLETGANIYDWEGTAAKQLTGYIKYNVISSDVRHFYGVIEGGYALTNRNQNTTTTINRVSDYGYDRINTRLGFSTKMTLNWRIAIEGTHVLRGRNINDSNSVVLIFSRNFSS